MASRATAAVGGRAAGVDLAGQVLTELRAGSGRTVSELAAGLGVARSTVQQRLDALLRAGLARPASPAAGGRGRPASVLAFAPGGAVVLAAHVGLTGSRVAVTDLAGEVLAERFVDQPVSGGQDRLVTAVTGAFDDALAAVGRHEREVAGVGVGLPSATDLRTWARDADLPATGDWGRAGIRDLLQERYDAPAFLDLDVNLLALAERRGTGPDDEVFVCVKLGTLIDASIVVNGAPVHGADGRAGELGHVKVVGSTTPCSCGGMGCLDASASGSAVVRQLTEQGTPVAHVSEVVRLALQGDPVATRLIRAAGRQIGEALAVVVNLLNPRSITAWGYLTDAEAILFAGIREGLYQGALPASSENLRLARTALGDLAGVRGAALMVADEVLRPAAVDRVLAAGSWGAVKSETVPL